MLKHNGEAIIMIQRITDVIGRTQTVPLTGSNCDNIIICDSGIRHPAINYGKFKVPITKTRAYHKNINLKIFTTFLSVKNRKHWFIVHCCQRFDQKKFCEKIVVRFAVCVTSLTADLRLIVNIY